MVRSRRAYALGQSSNCRTSSRGCGSSGVLPRVGSASTVAPPSIDSSWSHTARRQRAHAVLYALEHLGAERAVTLDESFEHATRLLTQQPRPGRPGVEAGTMEYVLSKVPYILIYRVRMDRVEIVRVYHTAQNRTL